MPTTLKNFQRAQPRNRPPFVWPLVECLPPARLSAAGRFRECIIGLNRWLHDKTVSSERDSPLIRSDWEFLYLLLSHNSLLVEAEVVSSLIFLLALWIFFSQRKNSNQTESKEATTFHSWGPWEHCLLKALPRRPCITSGKGCYQSSRSKVVQRNALNFPLRRYANSSELWSARVTSDHFGF